METVFGSSPRHDEEREQGCMQPNEAKTPTSSPLTARVVAFGQPEGGGRGCSWPSSAKTGTTVERTPSPAASPTSASTSSWARCSQTPAEVARQAIAADAHVVGISSLAGAHLTLVPQLIELLRTRAAGDIAVVVGGIIPPDDEAGLRAAGVAAILRPGKTIVEAADAILDVIELPR